MEFLSNVEFTPTIKKVFLIAYVSGMHFEHEEIFELWDWVNKVNIIIGELDMKLNNNILIDLAEIYYSRKQLFDDNKINTKFVNKKLYVFLGNGEEEDAEETGILEGILFIDKGFIGTVTLEEFNEIKKNETITFEEFKEIEIEK